jgi:predicted ATP-dependent Lon-type protease
MYDATVKFSFDATFTPTYGTSSWTDDDFIPEEHYLITAPAADLNAKQYFKLFEKFMLCVGMSPASIRSGAMSLVFNDCVLEEEQRKVCSEYELTMDEDLDKKFEEWKVRDEEFARLKKGPMGTVEYTDEEVEQMNLENGQ